MRPVGSLPDPLAVIDTHRVAPYGTSPYTGRYARGYMRSYKLGNVKIVECEDREEALRIADALNRYRQLWLMILAAEQQGLLSAN